MAVHGVIVIGLGLYFILIRPALLPEDIRFMGTTADDLARAAPRLAVWLGRVFWVMGGFMISTGILTLSLARSSVRDRSLWTSAVAMLAGLASLGWMVSVNFLIDSDFKWLLLALTLPWIASMILDARGR